MMYQLDNKEKSKEWLNSALIFTRVASMSIKKETGVVVDLY